MNLIEKFLDEHVELTRRSIEDSEHLLFPRRVGHRRGIAVGATIHQPGPFASCKSTTHYCCFSDSAFAYQSSILKTRMPASAKARSTIRHHRSGVTVSDNVAR